MDLLLEKTMPTKKFSPSISQDKLKILGDDICDNIDTLLEYFGIDYVYNGKLISMSCPIHGGDNLTALNIYPNGEYYRGNWKCRTHGCEQCFKSSIIGFVRGVLSKHKYDWNKPGDSTVSFQEAVNFCLSFAKKDLNNISVDQNQKDKNRFVSAIKNVGQADAVDQPKGVLRNQVRKNLILDYPYYLHRGFSQSILDKYDVGLCNNPNKEMYNRMVVPVYDHNHEHMIGCTGRSIFDKCVNCTGYHDSKISCPDETKLFQYSKWRHSKGLQTQNYLYNIWFAKEHIKKSYVVIVVESPGNVWRLEEAGIHNSVAIFGSSMSDRQKMILDASGAMTIITLMDNDEAGQKAAQKIQEKCQKTYNIKNITVPAPDVAEMSVDQIKQHILPFTRL